MDNKKEQERAALHSTIWRIANDLRGSVDGWDFKSYVLGILFYRFISENLTSYINEKQREAGEKNFSYVRLTDAEADHGRTLILDEKGFFVPPSKLFDNVRKKAANDTNLNETLETAFKNIEASAKGTDSENNMRGLFDDIDVNSNKLGATVTKRNELLVKLMNAIGDLNLGNYGDNSIDLFGDAYEYLMTMYAANAGKSGGEFFTPQEVSELLARITVVGKTEVNKVYDPACGSGSLLLKFAKVLGKENVRQGFYGQEINITTYNLCRINMFLHDINYEQFDIAHGDTLTEPRHWDDEPFEAIVSNPPYSIKWDGDANPILINDERFTPAGILAPKSKADLAFVMHALSWLATNGTAAIVCFPGVMYRGGAEQKIRQYLIDNNFVDAVIQLPPDLFFGTTIATCILVLKKNKSDNKVLFIDATAEFVRGSAKNKLTNANAKRILDCYAGRETHEYFSRLVEHVEIVGNNYNIGAGTYVVQKDTREIVDIAELNARISKIVKRQTALRTQIDEIVADLEVEASKLLSFNDNMRGGVSWKTMSEICMYSKTRIPAANLDHDNYVGVDNLLQNCAGKTTSSYVPEVGNFTRYEGDDILLGNIRPYLKKIWHADRAGGTNGDVLVIRIKDEEKEHLNPRYLYQVLADDKFFDYNMQNAKGAKMPRGNKAAIMNYKIPVPSMEEQERIVSILDKFDTLVSDISEGLPAEITARRQQYEHYRNRLLTFQEAS